MNVFVYPTVSAPAVSLNAATVALLKTVGAETVYHSVPRESLENLVADPGDEMTAEDKATLEGWLKANPDSEYLNVEEEQE